MAFGDRTIREPSEYEEALERLRHSEGALERHNGAVELLASIERDRHLTDLPEYDPVIERIREFERESGRELT